jgi:hypothetical protein
MLNTKFTAKVCVDSQGPYVKITDPEQREHIGLGSMEKGLHIPENLRAENLKLGDQIDVHLTQSHGRHRYEIGRIHIAQQENTNELSLTP